MRFWKWHALGNSYLVVEDGMAPELARRLCDVRYGIGSDGVVEVVAANGAQAEIVIWNPDGSVAEFSGNGSRIAAAWLSTRAATPQVTIGVSGRTYPAAVRDDGTVAMGVGEVEVGDTETIELGEERIELTAVSVGNPHAVVRLDANRDDLLRLGPLIERHERFPERTNVQLSASTVRATLLLVWERGAGETSASGSSAVAAAAAAVANGGARARHRPHAGRRAEGRVRRRGADHARRAGRGDLRGRASRLGRLGRVQGSGRQPGAVAHHLADPVGEDRNISREAAKRLLEDHVQPHRRRCHDRSRPASGHEQADLAEQLPAPSAATRTPSVVTSAVPASITKNR